MIEILNPTELSRARETGALVAHVLHTLKGRSTVGTNLLDIDRWAKELILQAGALSCYVDYAPIDKMGVVRAMLAVNIAVSLFSSVPGRAGGWSPLLHFRRCGGPTRVASAHRPTWREENYWSCSG